MFFAIISISKPCHLLEPHAKAVDFCHAASDESTFISFKSPFISPRQGMGAGRGERTGGRGGRGGSYFVLQVPEISPAKFSASKAVVISPLLSSFPSLLQVFSSPALRSSRQAPHQLACHMPHFLTSFWLGISNFPPAKESPV